MEIKKASCCVKSLLFRLLGLCWLADRTTNDLTSSEFWATAVQGFRTQNGVDGPSDVDIPLLISAECGVGAD
jgi:hypothetical protein